MKTKYTAPTIIVLETNYYTLLLSSIEGHDGKGDGVQLAKPTDTFEGDYWGSSFERDYFEEYFQKNDYTEE